MAICHLKRFAADQIKVNYQDEEKMFARSGKSVGVVGGGPAGLTTSHLLNLFGHKTTLYEAKSELGGMLRYGIPDYRVPHKIVKEDIRCHGVSG